MKIKFVSGLFSILIGLILVVSSFGTAQAKTCVGCPPAPQKVYVCKYVGTPGVDERLQTGQNPIEVSINAIEGWPVAIGSYFNDAHGRSFVLGFVPMDPEPTAASCPQPPYVPCSVTVPGTAPATVYGEWSACIEGTQSRTVTTYSVPLLDSLDGRVCVPSVPTETVEYQSCEVPYDPEVTWKTDGTCTEGYIALKLDGVIVAELHHPWMGEENISVTFTGFESYGQSPIVDNPNLNPDICTVPDPDPDPEPTPVPPPQVTAGTRGGISTLPFGLGMLMIVLGMFLIGKKK